MNKRKEGFELRNTDDKGEGIFATKQFSPNEIVMAGIIARQLSENHSHASQVGEFEYVLHAGLINKVNHSCDPNCGIRINKTGAHDFIAMKDIAEIDEITFDYAMRNYGVDYFPKKCMCNSLNCRGSITGWKDLPEDRKNKYAGYVAPYLLVMDEKVSISIEKNIDSIK